MRARAIAMRAIHRRVAVVAAWALVLVPAGLAGCPAPAPSGPCGTEDGEPELTLGWRGGGSNLYFRHDPRARGINIEGGCPRTPASRAGKGVTGLTETYQGNAVTHGVRPDWRLRNRQIGTAAS